jgi:hypothetical protein
MTAPSFYAKARSEVASMLGYDLGNLSAEQATRLDVATALRVLLDNQTGKLLRGESLDAREMLMASEALSRLLPPLREPPPAGRVDPRQRMWEVYKGMRDRGELHFAKTERAQLLDRIEALEAENEQLKGGAPAEPASPMPPPANVLTTAPKDAPAAAASAPQPSPSVVVV